MTREQLLASLIAAPGDIGDVRFDDGRYIDFSCEFEDRVAGSEGRYVEIGDEEDATVIHLTWAEIERVHRALTVLLLERNA